MVKSWAPEPPEDRDDHLPVLSSEHLIFPQSEDSDDMHDHPDPTTSYTLLASTNVEDHSNVDSDDSDDVTSIEHLPASSETIPQSGVETHSQTLPTTNSDSMEVHRLFSTPRPTDIVIDCEEVRAAMATVTLPPSAFPPWAVGVSDSELTNQIQRLLNKTTSTDSNNISPSTAVKGSE